VPGLNRIKIRAAAEPPPRIPMRGETYRQERATITKKPRTARRDTAPGDHQEKNAAQPGWPYALAAGKSSATQREKRGPKSAKSRVHHYPDVCRPKNVPPADGKKRSFLCRPEKPASGHAYGKSPPVRAQHWPAPRCCLLYPRASARRSAPRRHRELPKRQSKPSQRRAQRTNNHRMEHSLAIASFTAIRLPQRGNVLPGRVYPPRRVSGMLLIRLKSFANARAPEVRSGPGPLRRCASCKRIQSRSRQ